MKLQSDDDDSFQTPLSSQINDQNNNNNDIIESKDDSKFNTNVNDLPLHDVSSIVNNSNLTSFNKITNEIANRNSNNTITDTQSLPVNRVFDQGNTEFSTRESRVQKLNRSLNDADTTLQSLSPSFVNRFDSLLVNTPQSPQYNRHISNKESQPNPPNSPQNILKSARHDFIQTNDILNFDLSINLVHSIPTRIFQDHLNELIELYHNCNEMLQLVLPNDIISKYVNNINRIRTHAVCTTYLIAIKIRNYPKSIDT